MTGVEAISNGVPAFRKPEWRNARKTLVLMGTGLGVMFLGLSALAAEMEIRPFETGTPTVISQIGKAVFGGRPAGDALLRVAGRHDADPDHGGQHGPRTSRGWRASRRATASCPGS